MNHTKKPTDRSYITKMIIRTTALLLSVLCVLVVIPNAGGSVSAAQKLTDATVKSYEAQLEKIAEEIKKLQGQITTTEKNTTDAMAEKTRLDKEMNLMNQKIDVTKSLIKELEISIAEKNSEIDDKQAAYEKKYAMFKERLRVTREEGQASYLAMLFGAQNLADFLSRIDRIGAMLEYDQQIMTELKNDKANLTTARNLYETQKQAQQDLLAQQQKDEKELEKLAAEAAAYIKKLESNHDYYVALYEKNKEAEEKLQAEMEAYLKKLQEQQNSKYVGGKLLWPVPTDYTRVSSYYGYRPSPITDKQELHNGIDIPAPLWTPIYASNDGKVITATEHWSYGNYIQLDHGGGWGTLYAHCAKLLVKVGDKVKRGQVIAYVGSTGYSTGNHLHYSVFEDGKRVDPMKHFS